MGGGSGGSPLRSLEVPAAPPEPQAPGAAAPCSCVTFCSRVCPSQTCSCWPCTAHAVLTGGADSSREPGNRAEAWLWPPSLSLTTRCPPPFLCPQRPSCLSLSGARSGAAFESSRRIHGPHGLPPRAFPRVLRALPTLPSRLVSRLCGGRPWLGSVSLPALCGRPPEPLRSGSSREKPRLPGCPCSGCSWFCL